MLKKKDKDIYKKEHKIVYSFHAPEVECIGKGKMNKPYEFGNKVGIAVSGRGNFVLGVKSFHGNPLRRTYFRSNGIGADIIKTISIGRTTFYRYFSPESIRQFRP